MHTASTSTFHLSISANDVLHAMPHASNDINYADELNEVIRQSMPLLAPRFTYLIYDSITLRDGCIQINDSILHCGREITRLLRGSTQIAVSVCTVGEEITQQYQHYMCNSDFIKAYLCDIFANVAVEKVMKKQKENLRQELASQGLSITSNFCPGYCHWELKEQNTLLSLLPAESCPVTLTDSFLMQPMKSLSSIIGIGKGVTYKKSNCALCQLGQCIYRKKNSKN